MTQRQIGPAFFGVFVEKVDEVSFRGKCSAVGNTVWKSFWFDVIFVASLIITGKLGCADLEVDKNWEKCVNFVYRQLQNGGARTWK